MVFSRIDKETKNEHNVLSQNKQVSMLGLTFIGSGSKGNSALLELGDNKYLLDAGLSCKRIIDFLKEKQLTLENLSGILITHEHADHIAGLKVLLKKAPFLPVYSTKGTLEAIRNKGIIVNNSIIINPNQNINLSNCDCIPFNVPHDAEQPVGFRFEKSKRVMSIATDLGRITQEVIEYTQDADILCLESNYDPEMLRYCQYPYWLKNRIKGPNGHLPNEGSRGVLSRMNKVPCDLILMHLSQESNTPELARQALIPFFENDGSIFKKTHIHIASQNFAGDHIAIFPEVYNEN